MSVICKAGDLGKLKQICNSGHSRVNMFIKTLLKGYVHKGHKKTVYWHSFFFQKNYSVMKLNMCHIIFLFGKTTKVKNFLNPSSVHNFSSILRVHERWKILL